MTNRRFDDVRHPVEREVSNSRTKLHRFRLFALGWSVCLLLLISAAPLSAQINSEAIIGQPFGVARVVVPLTRTDIVPALLEAVSVQEREGRVFYPAISETTQTRLLDGILGGGEPRLARTLSVYFLFKGEAPFDVTITTSRDYTVRMTPVRPRRRADTRLMSFWWQAYVDACGRRIEEGDYPPIVEYYLTSMLANRLQMPKSGIPFDSLTDSRTYSESLQMMFGMETYRYETLRTTLSDASLGRQRAIHSLPAEQAWPSYQYELSDENIEIEPIAQRVPQECFYVRFGSWENNLWFSQLLERYGGDLSRMINLRGHDAKLNQKFLRQLDLEQSSVTELLAGQLVSDVAIIGRDTFFNEGAAVGVILQARNSFLLDQGIRSQRRSTRDRYESIGATLEDIEINGTSVSLLSTPDNRLRSFYVSSEGFHLTTSSREIVRRFLETAEGEGSLAQLEEFKYARSIVPVAREDNIFAYVSTKFLQGIVSPHYRIEMARRFKSVTDLEIVQLARQAAEAEQFSSTRISDLIDAKLLPEGFGIRPEGSGPILEQDRAIDSLRGARGYFLPIPDVPIDSVTAAEVDLYNTQLAFFGEQWERFDPLFVSVRRSELEDGREQLLIDAQVSPFGQAKYGWLLSLIGDPLEFQVSKLPNDIIHFQASVMGGVGLPNIGPHVLFAAAQDDEAPITDLQPTGFVKTLEILRTTPGYLGAWPKPGFFDLIPIGLGAAPDLEGFTRSLLGIWRWQGDGFSLISFDRARLVDASRTIDVIPAEEDAQIRLSIGDLAHSELSSWANSIAYSRARQTSIGNSRMLHAFGQQFRMTPDETREQVETLLNVELVDALGGEYELRPIGGSESYWLSNTLASPVETAPPANYQSPLLEWFRGLESSVLMSGDSLKLHLVIDVQTPDSP